MPNTFVADEDGFEKEIDEKGDLVGWRLIVDPGDGLRKQDYRGKTRADVTKAMSTSMANASRKIVQQERSLKLGSSSEPVKDTPIPEFKPRNLTADEKFAISQAYKSGDADKILAAQRLIHLAEYGEDPAVVRQTLTNSLHNEKFRRAATEATRFREANPEYIQCKENNDAMAALITRKGWALTAENYQLVFDELKDVLKLKDLTQQTVENPTTTSQGTTTQERPRSASLALNDRNSSAHRNTVRIPAKGPSIDEIEHMTASQFEDWSANPSNAAYYENLMKPTRR